MNKNSFGKKGLVSAVIFLFMGMSVISSTGTVVEKESTMPIFYDGDTLYVGGSGPNNYTTIQNAINDANNGYIVFVYNGTYNEQVFVNKRIKLIGENREDTIIYRENGTLCVAVSGVELSGFTIGESHGIQIFPDVNNSNIHGNIITQTNRFGITVLGSHNTISGNIITNNYGRGVQLANMVCNIINNTVINNTIINNEGDGIFAIGGSNNILQGNTIKNCISGISLMYETEIYIINNLIQDIGTGLSIYESSDNTFIGNIIENSSSGIRLSYSSCRNKISNNYINNSEKAGILLGGFVGGDCTNNIITNNSVFRSGWSGILLEWRTDSNIVSGNTLSNNENSGIGIWDSNNNQVTGNLIVSNNHYGIFLLDDSNYNNISRNYIVSNNLGINISNSQRNEITFNTFLNNRKNAFFNGKVFFNRWKSNFWNRTHLLPKPIFGYITILNGIIVPWLNFDWNPAQEPYIGKAPNYRNFLIYEWS